MSEIHSSIPLALHSKFKEKQSNVKVLLTEDQAIMIMHESVRYSKGMLLAFTGWGYYREMDWPKDVFEIRPLPADLINEIIETNKPDTNKISDGYHTFGELYDFRKMYNAALFNEWAKAYMDVAEGMKRGVSYLHQPPVKYQVHKSWKHYDGELCFGGGWFIVSAQLPTGQISNHYETKDWDLFRVPETEKTLFEFDGHTPADVLERLKSL